MNEEVVAGTRWEVVFPKFRYKRVWVPTVHSGKLQGRGRQQVERGVAMEGC